MPSPSRARSRRAWFLIAPALLVALAAFVFFVLPPRGARSSEALASESAAREPVDSARPAVLAGAPGMESRSVLATGPYEMAGATDALPPREIAGLVLGADGVPREGAECRLAPGTTSVGFGGSASDADDADALATRSDAAGRFRFDVGPGPWRLTVRAAGHALWSADHLHAGDDVVAALLPSVALSVRIRDAEGLAVAGARLRVTESFGDLDAPASARGESDAAGRAELAGLSPGKHYLLARHPEYELQLAAFEIPAGEERAALQLVLRPGVRLTGTVRIAPELAGDSAPPFPPIGTRVRVEAFSKGQSLVLEAECDAEGRFATDALLARGEALRATAIAPGFGESTKRLMIGARATGEQHVELVLDAPERRASGRAVDVHGEPLPGVSVRWTAISRIARGMDGLTTAMAEVTPHVERWRTAAATDADGRFFLESLSAERQVLVVLADRGSAPSLVWVPDSEAGSEIDLGDVAVVGAGGLFGVVRGADGAPAANERVRAIFETILTADDHGLDVWRPSRWWRPITTTTRADGSFRFDALAAGSYTVEVGDAPAGNWYVPAGDETGPIELLAGGADETGAMRIVEGRVLDPDEAPVKNALVALFAAGAAPADLGAAAAPEDRPAAMTFTDYSGAFKLRAPADAEYTLHVSDLHGVFVDHVAPLRLDAHTGFVAVDLRLDTRPGEALAGLVVGPDGLPLAGMDVALVPPENAYCGCIAFLARTDANGQVVFEHVSQQAHEVRVSDPGGRYRPEVIAPVRPGEFFEAVLGY